MAAVKLPFVTGPGIATSYTGPQTANALVSNGASIQVPYLDAVTSTLQYRTVNYAFLTDETIGPSIDFQNLLEIMWQAVKASWIPLAVIDPALDQQFGYLGGQPIQIFAPNLLSMQVELTQVSKQANEWFPQSNIAKFGWATMGGTIPQFPIQWLNLPSMSVQAPNGIPSSGAYLYLFKDCNAIITLRFARAIPNLIYSVSGGPSGNYPGDNDGNWQGGNYVVIPVPPSVIPQAP